VKKAQPFAGRVLLALCFSVMAGCAVAPSECDPSLPDPSLWVKAHCLYSGEYDRRGQTKQDALEEELRLKAVFEETYAALKAEQLRIEQQSAVGTIQLERVSRSVSSLQEALKSRAENDRQLKQQIGTLKVEVRKIQEQPGQSPVQQRQALSELMVKVSDLQHSLELR
jgi:chromosome segregation ATPase